MIFPLDNRHFITDSLYPEYFCSTLLLNRYLLIMGIQKSILRYQKLLFTQQNIGSYIRSESNSDSFSGEYFNQIEKI